ncbi:DUF6119 family protein [Williamsia deligens]|uniref:DUF6119 family protein n=1 Tax=Williamsia deligens TaxID=321325 RepID=A0ABW3G8K0_9NOCA|nr:DUF6119 family protein [Williamsia deligens]
MNTMRLTFHLLRDGVVEFDDARDPDKPGLIADLDPSSGIDGRFYYTEPRPSVPRWVGFVQPALQANLVTVRSSSTAGLLLLRTSGRMFALTFGYGRSLLDLSKIEYQFGLRVALNRIDPRQIRGLDTKTFEDLVVSTSTQASKSAELPTFGVDIATDILRAVTGEPRDRDFATRIAGSDSLIMGVKEPVSKLPEICDDLLIAFGADDYKTDFGWIDQLSQVRDPGVVSTLDQLLVDELRSGAAASSHLALPESIEWADVDGFTLGGTRDHIYDELDLDEYLERLGADCAVISLSVLKSRHVSVRFGRSGNFDKRSSIYRCLVSEQRIEDKLHVLIEGRWFAISSTLVQEVDAFAESLPGARLTFPPARSGEIESAYNARVASVFPDEIINLDARIRRPGGASSGIEFCDLLSKNGDLIHIKRKSRSSTLSHLFAQGGVSALTFVNDGVFRARVRELIEKQLPDAQRASWTDLIPAGDESVDRSHYCITYAVVANSEKPGRDWLPFFSKLNLMQQGRQLRMLGFGIAIARIPVLR